VQRLDQPIVTPAPLSAISIRDFIKLVEAEEAKWPLAEQTQTSLMITRLRKIFYGTAGWDDYLIPGAKGIASGYNISEVEIGRENLSILVLMLISSASARWSKTLRARHPPSPANRRYASKTAP
jgi:hypothetical protein